ncbi:alpha/beta fold hydrolase [Camelliibacillus cellulosilyticus]|uniref:Alpha/beta fold hydrolase n=1 Tax=Camelliibacillus cellulosilyticus TaxID=2174486 RepID=A0ABV9GRT6_9BACL
MPRFETTDGVKLFYETFGDSGAPVIFIHPPLMGHVVFKYQRALADQCQVIMYDLRGHGHSDRHVKDTSFARHTEDLRELFDHLQIDRAVIVGYSAAGNHALDFAFRYPDRVKALILSGGFPKVDTWLLKQEFNIGIWLMKRRKTAFLSQVLALTHQVVKDDIKVLYDYGKKANPDVVLKLYEDCMGYDCTGDLGRLATLPILALYGTIDFPVHAHYKWFQTRVPSAQIVFIDKGTHQLPTRFHEPFNHAVRQFLTRIT